MSDRNTTGAGGWKRFWAKGSGNIAVNVSASLIAAGLLSITASLLAVFSRINTANAVAFRIILAAASVAALTATAGLVVQFFEIAKAGEARRDLTEQLSSLRAHLPEAVTASRDVAARLSLLEAHIPSIDWSYDSAEHDRGVYERMRKIVENPEILEFKIVTIFRDPKFDEISQAQRDAVREYYSSLESALATRPGFDYDRVVVIRGALRHRQPSARDLMVSLKAARPEFMEHCRRLMGARSNALGARGEVRFYGDTGRLVDVAFAIALNKQKVPRTLVLEIGTTRPGDGLTVPEHHPALGLLAFENPSPQLAEAFLLAHQSLRMGGTAVEHVPDEVVKNILNR